MALDEVLSGVHSLQRFSDQGPILRVHETEGTKACD